MASGEYRLWRENDRISEFQPTAPRARVIIAAMGPNGLETRGKVKPELFFPSFCRVLGERHIASVYVNNMSDLDRELMLCDEMPHILIDLVNEVYDDLDAYNIPDALTNKPTAVFNSRNVAKIIGDKKKANSHLSSTGIQMPPLASRESKRIFSNARVGSREKVIVYNSTKDMDGSRYNTEFVDTRIQYHDRKYYTVMRIMCVASRLMQIFVRARHETECNPSVHNADTPQDRELLDYLYDVLASPRVSECSMLAEKMESALGPGFYAHDVLVDNESGKLFLCETGYKFFDTSYWKRVGGFACDQEFQYNIVDQETYAKQSAAVFIDYCIQRNFLEDAPL